MKKQILLLIISILCVNLSVYAQVDSVKLKEIEKTRTESGVDPTRVSSRFGYTFEILKPNEGDAFRFNNNMKLTFGVSRWSLKVETRISALYDGQEGSDVVSGMSDIKLGINNAFFVSGKHALAGGFDLSAPTGSKEFNNQAFTIQPNIAYAYTINPMLIFAVNPQYTRTIWRNKDVPMQDILTVRPFFALFLPSGVFAVIEPRSQYDFTLKKYDFIISPIIGGSIGGGFNLALILEIPTKQETLNNYGILGKLGIQKTL